MRRHLALVMLSGALVVTSVFAVENVAAQTVGEPSDAGQSSARSLDATPALLPDTPDTVRTNLWLVEALMAEVVADVVRALPPVPAEIVLEPTGDTEADELMSTVIARDLAALGYDVFRTVPDAADLLDEEETYPIEGEYDESDQYDQDAADDGGFGGGESPGTGDAGTAIESLLLTYRVVDIGLYYPDTGRRLGLWRQWVARDIELTVMISLQDLASGRLLLSDRYTRSFSDRVPDDDFAAVNSDVYPFTSGEPAQSGWKGRIEEIVVLGALAALVAIYLANTQ